MRAPRLFRRQTPGSVGETDELLLRGGAPAEARAASSHGSPISRRPGQPVAEAGREQVLIEQIRQRERRWRRSHLLRESSPRDTCHPLQGSLAECHGRRGLEKHLPVLGAYVRAQSVDPAVGGRAIRAQRALRGVYVEVMPTIGHLLSAGEAFPHRRAVKRYGEHVVIIEGGLIR